MNINQYIFREYDVRGKVEDDFPPEVVESLGKAFGTFIKRGGGQEIALSGDIRLTTPDLIEQFKTGVLSTGVDVINIGILPTPANFIQCLNSVFQALCKLRVVITHLNLMDLKCRGIKRQFLEGTSKAYIQ